MIRFLRNIRLSLMSDHKLRKYLFYAIGEVALVMIGILLALQVNNWNEVRKEKKKEQVLLKKLASDLEDDIISLEEIIKDDSLLFKSLSDMSTRVLSANTVEEAQIRDNALFRFNHFYANKTTLENIVSSGQIDIIKNDTLMDNLLNYYRQVKINNNGLDESIKNYSRDIENYLTRFDHLKDHPLLKKKSIEDYRADPFFLNSLFFKNGLLKYQMTNYKGLKERAQEILNDIYLEMNEKSTH